MSIYGILKKLGLTETEADAIYVRRDGTLPLLGTWHVGAHKITYDDDAFMTALDSSPTTGWYYQVTGSEEMQLRVNDNFVCTFTDQDAIRSIGYKIVLNSAGLWDVTAIFFNGTDTNAVIWYEGAESPPYFYFMRGIKVNGTLYWASTWQPEVAVATIDLMHEVPGSLKIILGDAAGAQKLIIEDNNNVEVASIDSNGLLTWTDIPDDSVKIEHLDAIDAPADEEVYAYDSATGRGEWVPQTGFPSLSQYVRVFDDFFSALTGDGMIGQQPWDVVNSGTGSAVSLVITDEAHPGVCQMATGTTTTGYACILLGGNVAMVFGGGEQLKFNFYIAALADATNDYECRMGFIDDVTVDPAEGAYFEYDRDTSANWLICAADNSVRTKTTSATAVTTGWHRFKIVVNSNATSIEYFIDDVSLGTVTTNIPATATRCFGIGFSNVKEAGTATRLFYTDYIDFVRSLSVTR